MNNFFNCWMVFTDGVQYGEKIFWTMILMLIFILSLIYDFFLLIIEFSKDKRCSSDLIHKFNAIATYNEKITSTKTKSTWNQRMNQIYTVITNLWGREIVTFYFEVIIWNVSGFLMLKLQYYVLFLYVVWKSTSSLCR